jgi:hypothetical protein
LQPYQKQGKVSLTNSTCPKSTFNQKRQYSSFFAEWFKPKADKNVEKAQVEAIKGEIIENRNPFIEKLNPEDRQIYEQLNKDYLGHLRARGLSVRAIDQIPEGLQGLKEQAKRAKDNVARDQKILEDRRLALLGSFMLSESDLQKNEANEKFTYATYQLKYSQDKLLEIEKFIYRVENSPEYIFQEYLKAIKGKNVSRQEIQRKFDSLFKQ